MKYLKLVPLILILILVYFYKNDISNHIVEKFVYYNESISIKNYNPYKLNYEYKYVKNIKDFKVNNKNDLINAIYTILNSGTEEFYFYCNYEKCKNDVDELANSETLSFINNYVHPYNSYKKVSFEINSLNKINIKFEKTYTPSEIELIEKKLDEIIPNIINDNMNDKEKIIAFHDYVINNSKYDSSYVENDLKDIDNPSHKATGILFYNKALCGGYADIMSIFLNRLNIPNFLVSSEYHVWNAVYLDGWYHLDLTWDDPVVKDGSDIRLDKFLLISDYTLNSYNTGYHEYDKNIYLEFNSFKR